MVLIGRGVLARRPASPPPPAEIPASGLRRVEGWPLTGSGAKRAVRAARLYYSLRTKRPPISSRRNDSLTFPDLQPASE